LYLIIPATGEAGLCAVVPDGRFKPPVNESIVAKVPAVPGSVKTLLETVSVVVKVTEPPDEEFILILPAIVCPCAYSISIYNYLAKLFLNGFSANAM
jgi:hypothetical protein